MEKFVCSVYDKAAESFGNIFVVVSKGLALRSFIDEVNRQDDANSLYRHSSDYGLYVVAKFDDGSGLLSPVVPPEMLMDGSTARNVG